MANTSISVKSILFVENDPVSQTMYQKRLEREGFHVECASDGQAALNILSERSPDLVLLDLMLPRVSGADVLKFMHADPRLTNVPVIIFSNAPMTEVPPDSPLAQGTKRLLKSDCTFPTLLGTIRDTLARAPEFVVMEAGKFPPPPPLAANNGVPQRNGDSHHNGPNRMASPNSEAGAVTAKKGESAEFLKEAVAMIPKIREHSMGYIKAPDSETSKTHLAGLQQRMHLLNSGAAQTDCARVALLTNAFDALLSGIMDKPSMVTPSVLQTVAQAVDCLDGLLKNNDGYSTGPAIQAKVLVVDDDTVCNHVNVTSLKRASFDAVGVKDPTAALNLLESTPFDLVVLDVNMPGMTGFDVCEKLRRLPHCRKTPVIFVTAFSNFDNRKQSVLSGGNDFVSKPVSPAELALKVTVNLIKARVQGGHAAQSETPVAAQNGSADKLPPPSSTRINQPLKNGTQPSEPPNRWTPVFEVGHKEPKIPDAPLKMAQPKTEPDPDKSPAPTLQSRTSTPPAGPERNGASPGTDAPGTDIHERLRQSTKALEHAKAGLEQESAERMRIESQWREQLNAAHALIGQTEAVLKEKETRCNQLETELAGLRREHDELRNKLSTEQQAATKSQQEIKEIKITLEKQLAERTRLEKEWREQLNAAKAAATQKETTLKEKETRCGQLEKELAGLQQVRNELQNKFATEQQAVAKSQQTAKELQERLNQVNAELERSQAGAKQQAAEQARLEKEWREQLNAAKTATTQKETALKEKETRCGQLEKELAGLQQVRNELQNKFATEQQAVAKSQQTAKELQERLNQVNAELESSQAGAKQQAAEQARLEKEWREQLNAAKAAIAQKETALKEKETRCGQLEKELAGLHQVRNELQNRFANEQQAVAKSQQAAKELQERLNQVSAQLEHVKAEFEKQSAEQSRLETDWRAQLNAAKTVANQAEAMVAEKESQCGQLEKELAGLQQVRDELQKKFAAEQQAVAKSQAAAKEVQERLNQVNAELDRARTGWEQESAKRTHLESEYHTVTDAREALNLELRNLRESQAAREADLREKQKKLADGLRENIQLLQLRLQEAEMFNGNSEEEPLKVAQSH